jgi:hypothetical protein
VISRLPAAPILNTLVPRTAQIPMPDGINMRARRAVLAPRADRQAVFASAVLEAGTAWPYQTYEVAL